MNIYIKTRITDLIKQKKISILISTFNKSKFIKGTIQSCLDQNYENYEIIIVDTESTDTTIDILREYSKHKKIRVYFIKKKFRQSPSLNQINAIKFGLLKSKGEIVCLLDGDDKFKRNKLKEINNFFQKNSQVNFVQDMIKNDKDYSNYNKLERYFLFFKILPKFFPTSTFSIRRKKLKLFFKKYNNFNLDLLEIDARLYFFSKIIYKDHSLIDKNLTTYIKDPKGISSKFVRFSKEWFKKRNQAHIFLKTYFKKNTYPYNFDFNLSRFLYFLIKKI